MFLTTSVAKWETSGKKTWIELFQHETDGTVTGFSYKGRNCGGNLGYFKSRALAILELENRVLRFTKLDHPSLRRVEVQ